jgi:hypothetical protein
MKRQRGRGRKSGGNPANRSYESNGPEVKIRGNASQIYEKYLTLARDATSSGDRVRAENLYQHAEHYFRIVQANQPKRDAEAEDGAENAEAQGEDGDNDQPQREDRGRGRGRNRRRGGDAPQADSGSDDSNDPLGVVTPEGDAAEGETASTEAGDGEEGAPRRRTRRPRRPRQSSEDGAGEASAEASDGPPSEGSDSESEAA